MPNSPAHLTEWALEQIAEGTLPAAEEARAGEHLSRCSRCQAEVEAYRALFTRLSALPRFAPTPGFADGVMARVRKAPETDPFYARLVQWLPRTSRGWAMMTGAVTAPALLGLALVLWVLNHPVLSFGGLVRMASDTARELALTLIVRAGQWATFLGLDGLVDTVTDTLTTIPLQALGAAAGLMAVVTPLSVWLLVRLLRTPMHKTTYAN